MQDPVEGLRVTHVDVVLRTCALQIQQRGLWSPLLADTFESVKRILLPSCIPSSVDGSDVDGAQQQQQQHRQQQAFAEAIHAAIHPNTTDVLSNNGRLMPAVPAKKRNQPSGARSKGPGRRGASMAKALKVLHPPETITELVRQWEEGTSSCPPLSQWTRDMRQDKKASLAHSKRKVVYLAFVGCNRDLSEFEARYGAWSCFTAMHREISRQNAAARITNARTP
eukprot:Opistho-2@20197